MNKRGLKQLFIIGLVFLLFVNACFAQVVTNERRVLKTANLYFDKEKFDEALPLFLKIDSLEDDNLVKYRIGACYLNTKYEKLKALPYLEAVGKISSIEVPIAVYLDLGTIYHFTYRFDDAISNFEKYLKLATHDEFADSKSIAYAQRMITVCKNAIEISSQTYKAEIDILGFPINTMESEYCPMISADERILVYMQTVGIGKVKTPKTSILLSQKSTDNAWLPPVQLNLENPSKYKNEQVQLAGLSPDGQTLFLDIGEGLDQDIYSAKIEGALITNISRLNKNINSNFYEGRVSISSDGTELFFVSDRPGGFGGTDIYKSKLTRKSDWGEPENLGEEINTIYNENSPFLHPDNQTLFFSSEGHKTMGGNDIFKSKFSDGHWSEPENLGFPNSPKDDLYFVLNASGQTGYFSSSKNNIYDKYDIYIVNFKDPIPLTLVKGVIKAGIPPHPISADIKVYDKETGIRVKYVYNPDPKTGKYLMIFPPAKNYDILVSAADYLPQLININIPYQTYFYELYQEITLNPIQVNNKMIGESVTVNNTFYDLYKTAQADSILSDEQPKQPKYYDHLLELVENIIQTTDTMRIGYLNSEQGIKNNNASTDYLLNMIEEAIETSDPVTLSILDANAKQKDIVRESHFYTDGDKSKSYHKTIIGQDTILSATPIRTASAIKTEPVISVLNKKATEEVAKPIKMSEAGNRNYVYHHVIYYDLNQDKIALTYYNQLNQICQLLIDNPALGVEIYGYTDSQGEKKYNFTLSRQRAQNVLKYFIDHKVDSKKMIAKGFGEITSNPESNQMKNRKVEINIFEIK